MNNRTTSTDSTAPVTLLFSGGIDSTMAATLLAEQHEQVHLLTFRNGYGHYHIDRTGKRAAELSRLFPGKFVQAKISVQRLFEEVVIDHLDEEYTRWESGFFWCLGCKIAMHTRAIVYNLHNHVSLVADGSSGDTSEMVEQMPVAVDRIHRFYDEYGMRFLNPVYERARSDSIHELETRGFRLGLRIGDRFLGIQPTCKPGELYYMPYLLRGSDPIHPEEKIAAYIDEKLDWARRTIDKLGGRL